MPDQALELLARESVDAALARLSALDRLLQGPDGRWWGEFEAPPSVRFAVRAGRFSSVARLLETLCERRPAIFVDQLDRLRNDRGAVVALARALRRLRIAGIDAEPADPELGSALRCSLPDATKDEIDPMAKETRKRAWWLELLSPPLSDAQVAALINIHETSRNESERNRARQWLCTSPYPVSIWRQLPKSQRRRWVDELDDFELQLLARLADMPPPNDPSERQDLTRLQRRIAGIGNTID